MRNFCFPIQGGLRGGFSRLGSDSVSLCVFYNIKALRVFYLIKVPSNTGVKAYFWHRICFGPFSPQRGLFGEPFSGKGPRIGNPTEKIPYKTAESSTIYLKNPRNCSKLFGKIDPFFEN